MGGLLYELCFSKIGYTCGRCSNILAINNIEVFPLKGPFPLSNYILKCKYHFGGCTFQGTRNEFIKHIQECPFKIDDNQVRCKECKTVLYLEDEEYHYAFECNTHYAQCRLCNATIPRTFYQNHLFNAQHFYLLIKQMAKNKVLKSNNNLTLLSDYFGKFGLAWELDSDNVEMKNNQL